MPVTSAPGADEVAIPTAKRTWHPVARRWYLSLRRSGQAAFYQPSDWATAYLVAEAMSRELNPQPVVDKDGRVTMVTLPPKASALTAWLEAMTSLLTTEGDRRRARLELQRPTAVEDEPTTISELDEYRRRLHRPPEGA